MPRAAAFSVTGEGADEGDSSRPTKREGASDQAMNSSLRCDWAEQEGEADTR